MVSPCVVSVDFGSLPPWLATVGVGVAVGAALSATENRCCRLLSLRAGPVSSLLLFWELWSRCASKLCPLECWLGLLRRRFEVEVAAVNCSSLRLFCGLSSADFRPSPQTQSPVGDDPVGPFWIRPLRSSCAFGLVLLWSRSTLGAGHLGLRPLVLASPSVQLCLLPKSAADDSSSANNESNINLLRRALEPERLTTWGEGLMNTSLFCVRRNLLEWWRRPLPADTLPGV